MMIKRRVEMGSPYLKPLELLENLEGDPLTMSGVLVVERNCQIIHKSFSLKHKALKILMRELQLTLS